MTQCSIPLGSPELTVVVHLTKLGTPGGKVFNRFCEGFQYNFKKVYRKFWEVFQLRAPVRGGGVGFQDAAWFHKTGAQADSFAGILLAQTPGRALVSGGLFSEGMNIYILYKCHMQALLWLCNSTSGYFLQMIFSKTWISERAGKANVNSSSCKFSFNSTRRSGMNWCALIHQKCYLQLRESCPSASLFVIFLEKKSQHGGKQNLIENWMFF